MDKIATLNQILAQNPADAFARYGLAMEYAGCGETEASIAEFDRLRQDNPDYAAGYFMAAQTLAKARRNDEAKARLKEGIAAAVRSRNQHAQSEMQTMLDDLEMED
jgi:predicted Zn-dependent protease